MDAVKPCSYCKHPGPHTTRLETKGVHHARIVCGNCERFIKFVPKPDSDPTKYRRPQQHRELVIAYSEGYCQLCLRKLDELPKGQTSEAHHVKEFSDGGDSERANVWILCTACHKMIHWMRTYHGSNVVPPVEAFR